MNRAAAKPGTGLQDVAQLILDDQVRPTALAQLGGRDMSPAADIALHVDLWLVDRRREALRRIHDVGGTDLTLDDLDLMAELLLAACARSQVARLTGFHQRTASPKR
jgi:hypothetical protein